MGRMDKEKFETLWYYMKKEASRDSFVDFLEYSGLTYDDYQEIKAQLEEDYNVSLIY